jgi:hypothetical protein
MLFGKKRNGKEIKIFIKKQKLEAVEFTQKHPEFLPFGAHLNSFSLLVLHSQKLIQILPN